MAVLAPSGDSSRLDAAATGYTDTTSEAGTTAHYRLRAVYSADYASRHDLPPTPTLQRALNGLVQKEIVAQGRDGEYRIVEPFLAEWLRREEAAT